MKRIWLGTACAAALLAAGSARAQNTTIVPSTAAATAPAVTPSTAAAAGGQRLGAWHQACDDDVRRFCSQEKGNPAVTACLDRNTARLSPDCKAIRAEEERRWKQSQHR